MLVPLLLMIIVRAWITILIITFSLLLMVVPWTMMIAVILLIVLVIVVGLLIPLIVMLVLLLLGVAAILWWLLRLLLRILRISTHRHTYSLLLIRLCTINLLLLLRESKWHCTRHKRSNTSSSWLQKAKACRHGQTSKLTIQIQIRRYWWLFRILFIFQNLVKRLLNITISQRMQILIGPQPINRIIYLLIPLLIIKQRPQLCLNIIDLLNIRHRFLRLLQLIISICILITTTNITSHSLII